MQMRVKFNFDIIRENKTIASRMLKRKKRGFGWGPRSTPERQASGSAPAMSRVSRTH